MIRVGQGWDIHRLVEGRALRLAGIVVPYERGLLGHSDGDAVLHALCDALLGAAALGDLGSHFPDTDPRHRGIDSAELVAAVLRVVLARGWAVVNADVTVIAEQPKLAPFLVAMRTRLAELLQLDADQVSLKAKTAEGLGAVGRGEAIAALAVVLLERREQPGW